MSVDLYNSGFIQGAVINAPTLSADVESAIKEGRASVPARNKPILPERRIIVLSQDCDINNSNEKNVELIVVKEASTGEALNESIAKTRSSKKVVVAHEDKRWLCDESLISIIPKTLLEEAGKIGNPILLKRGLAAKMEDLLMSAEYILSQGNYNVILCERGIRTFETHTRNTLDLNIVPVIKKHSHLPIIVDPSHGVGIWDKVTPMAMAAVACGADGLMIEVHTHPEEALSDGFQSLVLSISQAVIAESARLNCWRVNRRNVYLEIAVVP